MHLGLPGVCLLMSLQVTAQRTLTIQYTNSPPDIDGIISDGEWQVPDSAVNFTQMEPRPGLPATEATTAYISYDSNTIYAAFILYHEDPSGIVASIQQRDKLTKNDDLIALTLDTYNDKRKGYVFLVNPLGTQIDMRVNDDGRSQDLRLIDTPLCRSALTRSAKR